MKEQNTTSHFFITFFTLFFGLVYISSACQQADHKTAAAQDEETLQQLEREVFDAFELPGDAEAINRRGSVRPGP